MTTKLLTVALALLALAACGSTADRKTGDTATLHALELQLDHDGKAAACSGAAKLLGTSEAELVRAGTARTTEAARGIRDAAATFARNQGCRCNGVIPDKTIGAYTTNTKTECK